MVQPQCCSHDALELESLECVIIPRLIRGGCTHMLLSPLALRSRELNNHKGRPKLTV